MIFAVQEASTSMGIGFIGIFWLTDKRHCSYFVAIEQLQMNLMAQLAIHYRIAVSVRVAQCKMNCFGQFLTTQRRWLRGDIGCRLFASGRGGGFLNHLRSLFLNRLRHLFTSSLGVL